MSDNLGRRPIATACLLLLSLSCVGLALVPTSAYWLLMLLRCIQAAGSASTLAIGQYFRTLNQVTSGGKFPGTKRCPRGWCYIGYIYGRRTRRILRSVRPGTDGGQINSQRMS
jgi:hypothetical protein